MSHSSELVVLCMVVFAIARLVASDPTCSQLNLLDTKQTNLTTNLVNTTEPISEVFSALWCENNAVHGAVGVNVSVSLPREMVVYGLSTRGGCSGGDAYVNNFTVLYSNRDDVIVKVPMAFQVNRTSSQFIFFDSPMITDQLHFQIDGVVTDSKALVIVGVTLVIVCVILIVIGLVILIVICVAIRRKKQKKYPRHSMKAMLEESTESNQCMENSWNSDHMNSRERAKTPDNMYDEVSVARGHSKYDYVSTVPRYNPKKKKSKKQHKSKDEPIVLSANPSYSGTEIATQDNPAYSPSADDSSKHPVEKRTRNRNKGSRFIKILSSWLERDQSTSALEESAPQSPPIQTISPEKKEEGHYI